MRLDTRLTLWNGLRPITDCPWQDVWYRGMERRWEPLCGYAVVPPGRCSIARFRTRALRKIVKGMCKPIS